MSATKRLHFAEENGKAPAAAGLFNGLPAVERGSGGIRHQSSQNMSFAVGEASESTYQIRRKDLSSPTRPGSSSQTPSARDGPLSSLPPARESWLLRLFQSNLCDVTMAVGYLFNTSEPGVLQYLSNKFFVSGGFVFLAHAQQFHGNVLNPVSFVFVVNHSVVASSSTFRVYEVCMRIVFSQRAWAPGFHVLQAVNFRERLLTCWYLIDSLFLLRLYGKHTDDALLAVPTGFLCLSSLFPAEHACPLAYSV